MGFYPFNPCDDGYVFGAPQVEEMKLKLPNGKSLMIKAKNISKKNLYVKSISLNGKKIDSPRITHNEILEGGELVFKMCEKK
jgi:putative alpha-1,2-mannosidase